jgi:uncharacterized protein (TIGR03067 family)
MKRALSLLFVACSFALCGCGNLRDRAVLSGGNWVVERVELEGKDVTDESFEIAFGGMNESVTITVGDVIHKGLYDLDSGKEPKEIDIKPDASNTRDKPMKGIYALDGDGRGLKICLSPKKRPKKFETSAGSDAVLIILRRADVNPRIVGPDGEARFEGDPPVGQPAGKIMGPRTKRQF